MIRPNRRIRGIPTKNVIYTFSKHVKKLNMETAKNKTKFMTIAEESLRCMLVIENTTTTSYVIRIPWM